jgi:hypothetical protein
VKEFEKQFVRAVGYLDIRKINLMGYLRNFIKRSSVSCTVHQILLG